MKESEVEVRKRYERLQKRLGADVTNITDMLYVLENADKYNLVPNGIKLKSLYKRIELIPDSETREESMKQFEIIKDTYLKTQRRLKQNGRFN